MKVASVLALVLALIGRAQAQQTTVSGGDLYKLASPSVVLIEVYGDDDKVSGSGSGFIVSSDGEILTNYHVIAHTKKATVRLANEDAYDDVTVLDIDKRKDIALIKIKAIDLVPLKLGHSSSVQVGDKLYALGTPLGIFQNTLSEGILSGIRQADGYKIFQLSTPVSHGSSGSPVFNSQGQVVGIVEATIEEGQNLNLAIPIDYAVGLLSSHTPRSLESTYEPPEEQAPSASVESDAKAQPQPTSATSASDALKSDPLDYLPSKLGMWSKEDAEKELGQPFMRRDAMSTDGSAVIGDIYKYSSPAANFVNLELNFQRASGKLGAIYFYPQGVVSWQTVKGRLGPHYKKQKVRNGAEFYMYQIQTHTVAVFVDSIGNVVNYGVW